MHCCLFKTCNKNIEFLKIAHKFNIIIYIYTNSYVLGIKSEYMLYHKII